MTITRHHEQTVSFGPEPRGVARPADQIPAQRNPSSNTWPAPRLTEQQRNLTTRPALAGDPPAVPAAAAGTAAAAVPIGPAAQTSTEVPRQQVLDVMTRAGYPTERIEQAKGQLPDSVDNDRDSVVLAEFVLPTGELMERMGASP